jgi:hypothetical protein
MNPFHQLLTVDAAQWPILHRRAVVSARGRILHADDERMAATDEFVALTVPLLARLGAFALIAESHEPSQTCTSVLSRRAADVLRLLDCVLTADGRDNDYPVAGWLQRAFCAAHTQAAAITTLGEDEMPLSALVDAGAEALGCLLVLYAAGMGGKD